MIENAKPSKLTFINSSQVEETAPARIATVRVTPRLVQIAFNKETIYPKGRESNTVKSSSMSAERAQALGRLARWLTPHFARPDGSRRAATMGTNPFRLNEFGLIAEGSNNWFGECNQRADRTRAQLTLIRNSRWFRRRATGLFYRDRAGLSCRLARGAFRRARNAPK